MTNLIPVNLDDHELILPELKQSYHREAKRFLSLSNKRGGLSIEVMKEMVSLLKEEEKSGATINKYIAAMKAVVRSAYSIKNLEPAIQFQFETAMKEAVPAVKLASSEKEITKDDILSVDDYEILLNVATPRIALIMEFLWFTGARINETLSAKLSQCESSGDIIKVTVMGKGNKQRTIRISLDLFNRIKRQFRGETFLFESSRTFGIQLNDRNIAKQIRTLGQKYLNRMIGPHMFRHSFATRMIGEGKDIKAVSKYLGHATSSITLDMYVHNHLSNEDLGIIEENK